MPAYQSDYEDFYKAIEEEVKERLRIKIHQRFFRFLKRKVNNFITFLKIGKIKFDHKVTRHLFPRYYARTYLKIRWPLERKENGNSCVVVPRRYHLKDEPTNEKISLNQYAYGALIDKKFKKRFIDIENHYSESKIELQREVSNFLFQQRVRSSFILKLIVLLHLN